MKAWIAFDDGSAGLSPLCELRASFELRTGALTTVERHAGHFGAPPAALFVPEPLRALIASRSPAPINTLPAGDSFTLINGRWTRIDRDPPSEINSVLVDRDGTVIAAYLDRRHAERLPSLPPDLRKIVCADAKLLRRPWEILARCAENLPGDLALLARHMAKLSGDPANCVTVVGGQPVWFGRGVVVHPHVVFDTSAGPVVIDDGAVVRSMSVVVGPAYIGKESAVVNHGHIRSGTVIGPACKVGGEVNGCLFQGYANKAHSGYLGNSFVGEWVNLGADTVTSNLKNTYSDVRMQTDPSGEAEATGMRFLGSVIGDHVKTAIGTRMLTGTCLHTGSMVAVSTFPPKCVAPFTFLTDAGSERYELPKFLEVLAAVMDRRGLKASDALRERISRLYTGGR